MVEFVGIYLAKITLHMIKKPCSVPESVFGYSQGERLQHFAVVP